MASSSKKPTELHAVEDSERMEFEHAEEIKALRRSRSVYKGKYSHAMNELGDACRHKQSRDVVNSKLDVALKAYERFKSSHAKYLSKLDVDGSTYKCEVDYMESYESDDMLKSRVYKWLRDCYDSGAPRSSRSRHSSSTSSRSSNASRELQMQQLMRRQESEREIEDLRRRLKEREERQNLQDRLDAEEMDELRSLHSDKYPYQMAGQMTQAPKYLLVSTAPSSAPVCVEADLQQTSRNQIADMDPGAAHFIPKKERVQRTNPVHDENVSGLRMVNDLPKIKVPIFTGNPSEYAVFVYCFDNFIGKAVIDSRLKLNYLIQFCDGVALGTIKDYVLLGKDGYEEARKTLYERFGRPNIIMESQISTLTNGPPIKSNDGDALLDLATQMNRCELISRTLSFQSDIHNTQTLLNIMLRLPHHVQTKWVQVANQSYELGREPNFSDLYAVVRNAANVSTNFYGKHLGKRQGGTKPNKPYKVLVNTHEEVTHDKSTVCLYCSKQHHVSKCWTFKKLSYRDKVQFMRKQNRCFRCLGKGHIVRGCLSKERCTVEGCEMSHHALFHRNTYVNKSDATDSNRESESDEHPDRLTCNTLSRSNKVYLQIVPVKVVVNDREVLTNALLDSGSQLSLCTETLLKQLKCPMKKVDIEISTINSSSSVQTFKSSIKIIPMHGNEYVHIPDVYSVDSLSNLDDAAAPSTVNLNSHPHLSEIDFPALNPGGVGLLIGGNVPEVFHVRKQSSFVRGEPYASCGILGWTLIGPSSNTTSSCFQVNHCINDASLDKQLRRLWKQDFPLESEYEVGRSRDDAQTVEIVKESMFRSDNGHYVLPLPFKFDPDELVRNRSLAEYRLGSLKKRLLKDESLLKGYTETMEGYVAKGHAKKVSADQVDPNSYFLPHHAVIHPRKKKVRVVFDCAAKWKGISLNDALFSGPDVNNNILGVLLRFRRHPIALAADIEMMFHQVLVNDNHQKYLSFLWWPKGDLNLRPEVYQMCVHLFGAKSSPFCASFALKQTAVDSKICSTTTKQVIADNFYVDDCLVSVPTVDEATKLQNELRNVLLRFGFKLTKFITNSREVLDTIPPEFLNPSLSVVNLDKDDLPCNSALGLVWNTESDRVEVTSAIKENPRTRRGMLSLVASVYDPLGIVAPLCLEAKLIVQDLVRDNYGWDSDVDELRKLKFESWASGLSNLHDISISRCMVPPSFVGQNCKRELHHFCDASSVAYGAVSYMRLVKDDGSVACSFLLGKSLLAPLKSVTVPRLELCSALLATKLHMIIVNEQREEFDSVTFWTDSSIVLHSINNSSKRFKVFVANRLQKIWSVSLPEQWKHVSGKLNPADEATRSVSAVQFVTESRWLLGPKFLWQSQDDWPVSSVSPLKESELELKDDPKTKVCCAVGTASSVQRLVERYSDLNKLCRGVAWLQKFFKYLKKDTVSKSLRAEDLVKAERSLISFVQTQQIIKSYGPSPGKWPRSLRKLSPFFEEGILRAGGRLCNAPMMYDSKFPIILPNEHHLTKLIIQNTHRVNGHVGPHHTWTILRQSYWIVKGGVAVRSVLGQCIQCKRRNAVKSNQFMGNLPSFRLTPGNPPFYTTGLDCFGPFLVRRGRSDVKAYGTIFTCMASRAVHLELVDSLSASSFINSLRRFVGRRGKPHTIVCDNGTNFVGGKTLLNSAMAAWKGSEWDCYVKQSMINWEFNPPGASHMGGVWERLIRSTKTILESLLNGQVVNYDALNTVLVEVEAILNSRPLNPITLDPRDGLPLTPNDLLRLNGDVNLPPGLFDKSDNFARKRWRQVQYLAEQFWSRWSKEYVTTLLPRQKWVNDKQNVGVDDLVLVRDDRFPRQRWPLGRVLQVFPDKVGRVRQVDVKFNKSVHRRPISKLYVVQRNITS